MGDANTKATCTSDPIMSGGDAAHDRTDFDRLPEYVVARLIALILEIAPLDDFTAQETAEMVLRRAIRLLRSSDKPA